MGKAVGVAKTSEVLGDEEVFPNPVYSLDDHSVQVGFLGKNGYWAIGEQEPWCETCVSVSEELGENGAKIVITETYGPEPHDDRDYGSDRREWKHYRHCRDHHGGYRRDAGSDGLCQRLGVARPVLGIIVEGGPRDIRSSITNDLYQVCVIRPYMCEGGVDSRLRGNDGFMVCL